MAGVVAFVAGAGSNDYGGEAYIPLAHDTLGWMLLVASLVLIGGGLAYWQLRTDYARLDQEDRELRQRCHTLEERVVDMDIEHTLRNEDTPGS